jgi:hypothetical protein
MCCFLEVNYFPTLKMKAVTLILISAHFSRPTYHPGMMDGVECGSLNRIRMDRGNRNTQRKPAPVPRGSSQMLHFFTGDRTRAAEAGG